MRRIGILGGTFDPIHVGHLIAAEEARAALDLEQVLFIPAGRPPHKDAEAVEKAHHRYLMTVLATLENSRFVVSRLDMDRSGPSYTVDTLRLLREEYGTDAGLYFIVGADILPDLLTWKDPDKILQLCQLVVVTRPGFDLDPKVPLGGFYEGHKDHIHLLSIVGVQVEASDIRRRVVDGRSIRYLVPDGVMDYIHKQGLYRTDAGGGGPS